MLAALVLVLYATLALFPQVVLSKFNTITFSSIQQCGPFSVTFSGGKAPQALPLTLTIVPFNSTPIFITIPDGSWDTATSTGAAVTFLPLPAGQTFVASLDDADGNPTGLVSDVIAIGSSSNSSCLPATTTFTTPAYTVDASTISQCLPFNVTYDEAAGVGAPKVRGFIPRSFSLYMNETADDTAAGVATYTMEVFRNEQVALLLDDGNGHRETTPIISVLGDNMSSASCIQVNTSEVSSTTETTSTSSTTATASASTSKTISSGTVVAIGVASGSIVGGVLILVGLYIWRERKRRRALRFQMDAEFQSRLSRYDEKGSGTFITVPPPAPTSPLKLPGVRRNPIYVNAEFTKSPMSPEFIQYAQSDADGAAWPPLQSSGLRSLGRQHSLNKQPSVHSLRSLDIEQILTRATIYEENRQREQEAEAVASEAGEPGLVPMHKVSSPPPAGLVLGPSRKDENKLNVPRSPAYSFTSESAMDVPYTPVSDYTRLSAAGPWITQPSRARLPNSRESYSGTAL